MGCGCGKNKFPKKKSSRMSINRMTLEKRRANIIKSQNSKKNKQKE